MISIDEVCEPEWAQWYLLSPEQRWRESQQMWQSYLDLGGTLDPEPDTQSPFFDEDQWREVFADGRTSVRVIRRSGV
jgi:hypothetical protein